MSFKFGKNGGKATPQVTHLIGKAYAYYLLHANQDEAAKRHFARSRQETKERKARVTHDANRVESFSRPSRRKRNTAYYMYMINHGYCCRKDRINDVPCTCELLYPVDYYIINRPTWEFSWIMFWDTLR